MKYIFSLLCIVACGLGAAYLARFGLIWDNAFEAVCLSHAEANKLSELYSVITRVTLFPLFGAIVGYGLSLLFLKIFDRFKNRKSSY